MIMTPQLFLIATFIALAAMVSSCKEDTPSQPAEPAEPAPKIAEPPKEVEQPKPNIKHLEGEPPGPETKIAQLGEFSVNVAEFENAARIGALFGPRASQGDYQPVPPEQLAIPTVQFTTVRSVLASKVISKEAKSRNLEVSKDEITKLYNSKPEFAGLAFLIKNTSEDKPLEGELAKLGIEPEDFWAIGEEVLLREKLADALVSEITEEDVWQAWSFDNTRSQIAALMLSNTPSTDEIDVFVEKKSKEIEEFFKENERRFRPPERVILDILNGPADKLQAAEADLATQSADAVALKHNLTLRSGIRMGRRENSEAFRAEIGDHGYKSGSSPYLWKVVDREKTGEAELTRPLKREIAAEILRTQDLTPDVKKRLKAGQRLMKKLKDDEDTIIKLKSELAAKGLELHLVEPMVKSPSGSMPVFGLAPEVVEKAFELKEGRTSQPFVSRERGFVIHVLKRYAPDKEVFDSEKKELIERYKKELRPVVVDRYVQGMLGTSQLNLHPLGVKFGIVQKDP